MHCLAATRPVRIWNESPPFGQTGCVLTTIHPEVVKPSNKAGVTRLCRSGSIGEVEHPICDAEETFDIAWRETAVGRVPYHVSGVSGHSCDPAYKRRQFWRHRPYIQVSLNGRTALCGDSHSRITLFEFICPVQPRISVGQVETPANMPALHGERMRGRR